MDNNFFELISQSLSTIAVNFISMNFFKKKYGKKYQNNIIYISAFVLWNIIMIGINSLHNPILNMIFMFLSSELFCISLFKTNVKKSFVLNILLVLIGIFCDATTFFIWSALLGKTTNDIYQNMQLMIISNLLYVLTFFIAYRIFLLVTIKSDTKILRLKETVFLFIVTIVENFIVYNYTLKISQKTDGIVIIAFLILFLCFNIYITYLVKSVSDTYEYKYKISMLTKQNTLQLENFRDLDYKYNQSIKIIHDMKKNLRVYDGLKDNQRADDYKQTLEDEISKLFRGYQCSNTILSIIISQSLSQAEKENIIVDIQMEDLSLSFITDLDITAIFANLWDNAIEACKEMEEGKRHIDFIMRKVNGFIIINMENVYFIDKLVFNKNGRVVSSKENHMGVGLSIVESVVEKYNGFFHINQNVKDKFVVELTIPIEQ